MPAKVVVLGGGVGGTLVANLLAKDLGRDVDGHRRRPDRHARLPARLPLPGARVRPTGDGSLVTSGRCSAGTWSSSSSGRSGSIRRPARCSSRAAGRLRSTTWSSRRARVWCPSAIPGLVEGAHEFYSLRRRAPAARGAARGSAAAGSTSASPASRTSARPRRSSSSSCSMSTCGGAVSGTAAEITLLSPLNRAFTIESASKLVQPIMRGARDRARDLLQRRIRRPVGGRHHVARGREGRVRPAGPGAARTGARR